MRRNIATSLAIPIGPDGKPAGFLTPGTRQIYVYNPQPPVPHDWSGWGPRLSLDYGLSKHTTLHAGGAITTILPNLGSRIMSPAHFRSSFNRWSRLFPAFPLKLSGFRCARHSSPSTTTQGQLLFASEAAIFLPTFRWTCSVSKTIWLLSPRAIRFQLFTTISFDPHFPKWIYRHGHLRHGP